MKRILLLMVLLCIGKMAFPDSSFLPGLKFHYLYRDNEFIFGTSERGIPEEEYISFLWADENLLGEKVALISALASYFKWRDIDDDPDNDDENYFEEYTMQFKKKAQERYKDQLPSTVQLLIALMNDYETFSSHTSAYDRLAAELGNSLTAPSVKGIAYGYDILYNRKWDRVEKYEDDYLGPYLAHRQTYGEDIHTGVHKKVEEWLFYIHELRDKSIPEGLRVIQEDESLVSDEPLEIESYQEEDGTWVVLARKRSGENFSKTILLENEQTQVEIEITYKWIGETETWKELSKLEKTYVAHQNPILIIGYVWDKQTHAWLLEAKAIMDYTYDEGSDLLSTTRTTYEWKEDTWCEDYREEVDFESGEPVSIKVYEQGLLVFSEELKK